MKSMDDDPWWVIVRRLLERDWTARVLPTVLIGIPAISELARGRIWLGSALITCLVGLVTWVIVTGERSRFRRLVRSAKSQLPERDGYAALRGTVATVETPMVELYSRTPCAAAWSRTVYNSDNAIYGEQIGATHFVLQCGDALIAIDGSSAEVLADPAHANTKRDDELRCRYEWITAAIGDPVIVAGVLSRGPDAHPHRRAAQMIAASNHPVTIGLLGNSLDKGGER